MGASDRILTDNKGCRAKVPSLRFAACLSNKMCLLCVVVCGLSSRAAANELARHEVGFGWLGTFTQITENSIGRQILSLFGGDLQYRYRVRHDFAAGINLALVSGQATIISTGADLMLQYSILGRLPVEGISSRTRFVVRSPIEVVLEGGIAIRKFDFSDLETSTDGFRAKKTTTEGQITGITGAITTYLAVAKNYRTYIRLQGTGGRIVGSSDSSTIQGGVTLGIAQQL